MSAGTIVLTNNSAVVTGSGTTFTTDLKPNDFIVSIVGGVTYTLGVKSIESATALTLISNYGGPTASGQAWTAVPNATLVGITAQVASDVAKAIRGLNLDKANWQQVYSASGNITVTLPDGSTFNGPSWNNINTTLGNKANKGANGDITALTGLTTPITGGQGGTGTNDITRIYASIGFGPGLGLYFRNPSRAIADPPSLEVRQTAGTHGGSTVNHLRIVNNGNHGKWARLGIDGGFQCRQGGSGAVTDSIFNYNWTGNLVAYIDDVNVGNIPLTTSDERAKDIHSRGRDGLESLQRVVDVADKALIEYNLKDRGGLAFNEKKDLQGFSAQELQKIWPYYASGNPTGDPEKEGMMNLEIFALVSDLFAAVAEQNKQITALSAALNMNSSS